MAREHLRMEQKKRGKNMLWPKALNCMKVAPIIKERMMKKGSMMLGYQPHQGKVNFFRQVVISPHVSREDMDFLLDEIELLAKDL
ncbi:hypothetical protein AV530_014549 [Patagioenas fasciata monilis]|uniref:Uncharacterized protein n=1 Tax=Patagioenas fasciata monilis TaxID=372326 RepID=A0A1V4KC62_PATFA|nr:hypothetical protein AV530_014549 [Patagioenas fasciata monilis]